MPYEVIHQGVRHVHLNKLTASVVRYRGVEVSIDDSVAAVHGDHKPTLQAVARFLRLHYPGGYGAGIHGHAAADAARFLVANMEHVELVSTAEVKTSPPIPGALY